VDAAAAAGGVRTTTIHDLVPLRFPSGSRRDAAHARPSATRSRRAECDVIICNSRHTAGDVHEHWAWRGAAPGRYPGLDPAFGRTGQ
jgi:hypothetical protein